MGDIDARGPPDWAAVLTAARAGSNDALGRLLDAYRPYLLAVAGAQLDTDLQAKVGASDMVQESLLEGQRDFAGFHGQQPDQLLAWLRKILLNNLANLRRQFRDAAMRDLTREVPLNDPGPGAVGPEHLVSDSSSPSGHAIRREGEDQLQRALARLPDRYRSVIVWRNREGLSFAAIGARLGGTPEAARLVWWRALNRLKDELGDRP